MSIPNALAAEVLYSSDRTCCVCRQKGKPIQIHHVDDDPANNAQENLAVLCLDCHRETQLHGGFDRKLDAEQIILYRQHWLAAFREQRELAGRVAQESPGMGDETRLAVAGAVAEVYRENEEYGLLAAHYSRIGNKVLRDRYAERALEEGASDFDVCHLRLTFRAARI